MIGIIAGSHRHEAESLRVAQYIAQALQRAGVADPDVISLTQNPLPLWDERVWSDDPSWRALWMPIADRLRAADGFVVVVPEWSGMAPAGLKNFFLLCDRYVLAHKPALIVAVSAGMGGAYPVAELRISSYKNTRVCYLPDQVIIRHVGQVLHGETPADETDAALRQRLDYQLRVLLEYTRALRAVRRSGVIDLETYPHGM